MFVAFYKLIQIAPLLGKARGFLIESHDFRDKEIRTILNGQHLGDLTTLEVLPSLSDHTSVDHQILLLSDKIESLMALWVKFVQNLMLISLFWTQRLGYEEHIPGQTRDWNEELQTTRELPRKSLPDRLIRERAIFKVHSDFVVAATRGAMAVIDGNIMAINPGEDAKWVICVFNILRLLVKAGLGPIARYSGLKPKTYLFPYLLEVLSKRAKPHSSKAKSSLRECFQEVRSYGSLMVTVRVLDYRSSALAVTYIGFLIKIQPVLDCSSFNSSRFGLAQRHKSSSADIHIWLLSGRFGLTFL